MNKNCANNHTIEYYRPFRGGVSDPASERWRHRRLATQCRSSEAQNQTEGLCAVRHLAPGLPGKEAACGEGLTRCGC